VRKKAGNPVRKAIRTRTQRARGTGCVTKISGSRFWYVLYYQDGRQIRESSGSEVKQVAEQLLQRRLGEKALGFQPAQLSKKLKYEDVRKSLLDHYAANKFHGLQTLADGTKTIWGLPHLDRFFGHKQLSIVTTDTLRAFIIKRQGQGAESATINRNMALLRRMLFLAQREGKIRSVPYFPMLKEGTPRKGFLEHAQFERLLNFLPAHLRALVIFLYFTGCRLGEARKISWDQMDLRMGQVRLHGDQTKNAEPRTLPLPKELIEMLHQAKARTGAVFYQGAFRKSWISACIKADLGHREGTNGGRRYEGLIVHDLRRSAVRNLVRAGVAERVAMTISGHKTRSVFDRYNIVSTDDLQHAMARVESARRLDNNTSSMQVGTKTENQGS
jgi:integrase